MNIDQIRNFIIVAQAGSFGGAQERTHLTRQALKKQVDAMEEELEVTLLERTRQGVSLTKAGERFLQAASKSLPRWDELVEECRAVQRSGDALRIGNPAHPRILLENILNEFVFRYPEIPVNISIIGARQDRLAAVQRNELDLAEFVYRPQEIPEGIEYAEVDFLEYHCVILDTHPLACKSRLSMQELAEYPVAISFGDDAELTGQFRQLFPDICLHDVHSRSIQTIYNVCYNHGVYISKSYFSRHLEPLVSIPLDLEEKFSCGVIYRSNPSESVRKFLALAEEFRAESLQTER